MLSRTTYYLVSFTLRVLVVKISGKDLAEEQFENKFTSAMQISELENSRSYWINPINESSQMTYIFKSIF